MPTGSGSTCLGIVTSGLLSQHYVWLAECAEVGRCRVLPGSGAAMLPAARMGLAHPAELSGLPGALA